MEYFTPFDYRLTQYQPRFTEADLLAKYESAPEVVQEQQRPRTPVQAKMEAEDQRRRMDSVYENQANDVDAVVPRYLHQGLTGDLAALRKYAQKADLDGVRRMHTKIQGFVDDYQGALVSWTNAKNYGSEFAETMSTNADTVLNAKYLDDIKVTSHDGRVDALTLRQFLDGSTPEAVEAAVPRVGDDYGVSPDAARIIADRNSKFYPGLNSAFRELNAAEGQLAFMRANEGKGAFPDATVVEKLQDQVERARAWITLASQHMATTAAAEGSPFEGMSPDRIQRFYNSAYKSFGSMNLPQDKLTFLLRQYNSDMESGADIALGAGDAGKTEAWFSNLVGKYKSLMPKYNKTVVDGVDDKGSPRYKVEETTDDGVDPFRLVVATADASDLLAKTGKVYGTAKLQDAAAKSLARARELERNLDQFSFEDLGYANIVAQDAARNVSGGTYVAEDGRHNALEQVEGFANVARTALGFREWDPQDESPEGDAMGRALVSSAVKAYVKHRDRLLDGNINDPDGRMNQEFAAALLDDVSSTFRSEFQRRTGRTVGKDDADLFARSWIDDMTTGGNMTVTERLLRLGGMVLANPLTGAPELTPGQSYVSPRNGQDTNGNVSSAVAISEPGMMGYKLDDVKKFAQGNTVDFGKAQAALKDMATGALPFVRNSPNAELVKSLASGVFQIQKEMERDGFSHSVGEWRVDNLRRPAGGLAWVNLEDIFGADLGKTLEATGLPEFVKSGDFFAFAEGRDKFAGATPGDRKLAGKAAEVMENLSGWLIDHKDDRTVDSAKPVVVQMLARTAAEWFNRENRPGKEVPPALERLLRTTGLISSVQRNHGNERELYTNDSTVTTASRGAVGATTWYGIDDKAARGFYKEFTRVLNRFQGLPTLSEEDKKDPLHLAGYDWDPNKLGKKLDEAINYGVIGSVWEQRHRSDPDLSDVPEKASPIVFPYTSEALASIFNSPGGLFGAPSAGQETPAQQAEPSVVAVQKAPAPQPRALTSVRDPDADRKDRFAGMLKSLLGKNSEYNLLRKELARHINVASFDKDLSDVLIQRALADFDEVYRAGGNDLKAAHDYVRRQYMSKQLLPVPESKKVFDANGREQEVIKLALRWCTPEDLDAMRIRMGLDEGRFNEWKLGNQVRYKKESELAARNALELEQRLAIENFRVQNSDR